MDFKGIAFEKRYKLNHQIKYPKLRVIINDGENLGVITTQEALRIATGKELDLVLITDKSDPPIAKILDFNKFLYEENKKNSQSKAKSKKSKLKEFRFGPTVADDFIEMRVARAKEFIEDGNRVKFTVLLRGRQKAYPNIGREKLEKIVLLMADKAKPEEQVKQLGGSLFVTFVKN